MPRHDFGQVLLRGGLAALFLWFGLSQIAAPADWVAWVPAWLVVSLSNPTMGLDVPAQTFVLLNGMFEVILGLTLAAGFMTRWVALLLSLHLFLIAYEVGYNDIGVRDFALGIATLSLFFFQPDQFTLDRKLNRG